MVGKLNSRFYNAFPPFPYTIFPPFLLTLLPEISLWFFACRLKLWSSFWIKNQSERKIFFPLIFPAFSGHFFYKNFALGLCGVSKVINIGSGNSILDSIMHFPLSLYHFLPYSRVFSLLKAKEAFWLCNYRDFSLIFCMQTWIVI